MDSVVFVEHSQQKGQIDGGFNIHMETLRQVLIKSGNTEEVCYLEDVTKLKVGNKITLKDEEDGKLWEIVRVGATPVEKGAVKRSWHVGGL